MNVPLDGDFNRVGYCIGQQHGLRGWILARICRWTGHILWRNTTNAGYMPEGGSIPVHTCHCRRCFAWGWVEGDYKPRQEVSRG